LLASLRKIFDPLDSFQDLCEINADVLAQSGRASLKILRRINQ
jgi:hypothetical protein